MVAPPASSLQAGQDGHSFVVAQAGSAGGVIGKQGKSVSGGDDKPAAQPRRSEPKTKLPARATAIPEHRPAPSPCGKVAGVWSWFIGGDVTISAGGTAVQPPRTASWTCEAGQIVMVWSHGFTDRLVMSADGTRLSGGNQIGVSVSATRKGH